MLFSVARITTSRMRTSCLRILEWVGVASYSAPDTVQNYELQTVELLDFINSTPGVMLSISGARYLLAIGYGGASNVTFNGF